MSDIRAVEIEGTIKRIRTMADGSIDLTINLSETCRKSAALMLSDDWVNEFMQGVLQIIKKDESGNYGL